MKDIPPDEVHRHAGVWQLQSRGPRTGKTTSSCTTGPPRRSSSTLDSTWIMDQKLPHEEIGMCCPTGSGTSTLTPAHGGRSTPRRRSPRCLLTTAEVNNAQILEMHRSGVERERLLKYKFDRFSVQRDKLPREYPQHACSQKYIRDVTSKVNALDRRLKNTTDNLQGQTSQRS